VIESTFDLYSKPTKKKSRNPYGSLDPELPTRPIHAQATVETNEKSSTLNAVLGRMCNTQARTSILGTKFVQLTIDYLFEVIDQYAYFEQLGLDFWEKMKGHKRYS